MHNAIVQHVPGVEPAPRNTMPTRLQRLRPLAVDVAKRVAGGVSAGLNELVGKREICPLGILTYHRIADRVPGVPQPSFNVAPKRFRRQLAGLLDRRFSFWPLRRALEHHEAGKEIPPRTLVVTFDDAYESVYTNAWPVLRELNVPATLFLSTAYLDHDGPFPFDRWGVTYQEAAPSVAYRPIRERQCREMADDGLVELGAHTHTHQDFRGRPEELRDDLKMSVDVLRSRFGRQEVTFAFPYGKPSAGYADDALIEAARQAGVVSGLTTEMCSVDPQSSPFGWGRFNVDPWDTPATLDAKLSGWYGWAPRLKACAPSVVRRLLN